MLNTMLFANGMELYFIVNVKDTMVNCGWKFEKAF